MDWIYLIGPGVGMFFGWGYGKLFVSGNIHRMRGGGIFRIGDSPGWVPSYMIFGALWGVVIAFNYREIHKKDDTATGEFYTDTKEYKKRIKEKEQQDKTTKDR